MPLWGCRLSESKNPSSYCGSPLLKANCHDQTVLQCLSSQCNTPQFGSALHNALSECSEYPFTGSDGQPLLILHQGIRKRAAQNQLINSARPLVSAHQAVVSAQAIQSAPRRLAGASAPAHVVRPTRSAYFSAVRTTGRAVATQATLPSGLDDVGFNENLAPVGVPTRNIPHSQNTSKPVITGFSPSNTEARFHLGKASRSISFTSPTGFGTPQNQSSITNKASTPTGAPLALGTAGPYVSRATNSSFPAVHLPSSTTLTAGFNATTPVQRLRRYRWS